MNAGVDRPNEGGHASPSSRRAMGTTNFDAAREPATVVDSRLQEATQQAIEASVWLASGRVANALSTPHQLAEVDEALRGAVGGRGASAEEEGPPGSRRRRNDDAGLPDLRTNEPALSLLVAALEPTPFAPGHDPAIAGSVPTTLVSLRPPGTGIPNNEKPQPPPLAAFGEPLGTECKDGVESPSSHRLAQVLPPLPSRSLPLRPGGGPSADESRVSAALHLRHGGLPPPTGASSSARAFIDDADPLFWRVQESVLRNLSSQASLALPALSTSSAMAPTGSLPPFLIRTSLAREALSSDLFHARRRAISSNLLFPSSTPAAAAAPPPPLSSLLRFPLPASRLDAMTAEDLPLGPGGDGGGEAKSPTAQHGASSNIMPQHGQHRSPLLHPVGLDQLFRVDPVSNAAAAASPTSLLPHQPIPLSVADPPMFTSVPPIHNSQYSFITFPHDTELHSVPPSNLSVLAAAASAGAPPAPAAAPSWLVSSPPSPPMARLQRAMHASDQTQQLLQDWDKLHGLPKSHSATMVCTSRSRRQLREGRILPKWDGTPLISKDGRPEPKSRPRKKLMMMASGTSSSCSEPPPPPPPPPPAPAPVLPPLQQLARKVGPSTSSVSAAAAAATTASAALADATTAAATAPAPTSASADRGESDEAFHEDAA